MKNTADIIDQIIESAKKVTHADIGLLVAFARRERRDFPLTSLTRLLAAGLLAYVQVPRERSVSQIVADNRKALASYIQEVSVFIEELQRVDVKNPKLPSEPSHYQLRCKLADSTAPPCTKLQLTAAGWSVVEKFGVKGPDAGGRC